MTEDQVLNTAPMYRVSHTFTTADVTGTFDGLTQGDVQPGEAPVIDFAADPFVTKEGVDLFPINSEFGFIVTDFDGAIEKDFEDNPEFAEGWAGDLIGIGGEQLGIVISDAPTDTFKTPAKLGTWLAGLGGNTVKASTEHYVVMQDVLSDQTSPDDPDAVYPLDNDLRLIGGEYDGMLIEDVLPLVGDVNGDGEQDIRDVLEPNESTIASNIAASTDYSVTLKDDGKLLYRWGNTVKRPNDVRLEVEMPLPEEWSAPDPMAPDFLPLYRITQAELITDHTITNNPNDQIRPEDFENESAIGKLPTYEVLPDGKWVTTDAYYSGNGTLYPAGTVLKDPDLALAAQGSTLASIGALSSDLEGGFTNAWYTTMNREPFEAELNDNGTEYLTGPRWRLQPDKYGQDLPSVVIPSDPSQPPPPTNDEVKYEVGADTTTVINLLDWEERVSPLSISAGWQANAGVASENGLNMTENFDIAFYVKGDIKPATLYDTELVMDYEEIAIADVGAAVSGTADDDYLAGLGGNSFSGGDGEDFFVLSYGVSNNWTEIAASTVTDFEVGSDTIGLFDFGITEGNFDDLVQQTVNVDDLDIALNGFALATLEGVGETLAYEDFVVIDRVVGETITGTALTDYLVGDAYDNDIRGLDGDDTLLGLDGDDVLNGGRGNDVVEGGVGDDAVLGLYGNDVLEGGEGNDYLNGSYGSDTLWGGAGDDKLTAGAGEADQFVFMLGDDNDLLAGFETGLDTLHLDASLWGDDPAIDIFDPVAGYAVEVTAARVEFDFGGGDTLTVQNAALGVTLADLEASTVFV